MKNPSRLLLWLAGWTAILLIVSLLAMGGIVQYSRQQLESYIRDMEMRGEKFNAADLAPKLSSQDKNGVDDFFAAIRKLEAIISAEKTPVLRVSRVNPDGRRPVVHRQPEVETNLKPLSWEWAGTAYSSMVPVLEAIRVSAKAPVFEFYPEYTLGSSMPIGGPVETLKAGQFLNSEALISLSLGNSSLATLNVETTLRLAELDTKQHLLISQLVAVGLVTLSQTSTWEILQSHSVTNSELVQLQEAWERLAIARAIPPTLRMERAWGLAMFEEASPDLLSTVKSMTAGGTSPSSFLPDSWADAVDQFQFLSWRVFYRYADELQFLQNYQRIIDEAPHDPARGPWADVIRSARDMASQAGTAGIERLFSKSVLPAITRPIEEAVQAQAISNLTITAIALKRYHLDHSRLPDSLAELTPEYLSASLTDPFDGEPLRYRRISDSEFSLYSVGRDLADDNGDFYKPESNKRISLTDSKDIVWPMPAL